jgi:protein-disulfide isomerase
MAAAAVATAAMAAGYLVPPPVPLEGDDRRLLPLPLPDRSLHLGTTVVGNPSSQVGILLFTDLSCATCTLVTRETMPLLRRYAQEGNAAFGLRLVAHQNSPHLDTVRAAVCANEQKRFWEVHESLFARVPNPDPGEWKSIRKRAEIDEAEFERCIDMLADRVIDNNRDVADAARIAIVPTLFIGILQPGLMMRPLYRLHGHVETSYVKSIIDRVPVHR